MGVSEVIVEDIDVSYDLQTGQMLTGTFMDYAMPRGDDLPAIRVESNSVPTLTNPLGVKGAGEAGTIGAMPCVMNATIDALSHLGITQLDMPLTPEQVWQALQTAKLS